MGIFTHIYCEPPLRRLYSTTSSFLCRNFIVRLYFSYVSNLVPQDWHFLFRIITPFSNSRVSYTKLSAPHAGHVLAASLASLMSRLCLPGSSYPEPSAYFLSCPVCMTGIQTPSFLSGARLQGENGRPCFPHSLRPKICSMHSDCSVPLYRLPSSAFLAASTDSKFCVQ